MPSMPRAFPPFQRQQGTNIFDLDGQAPAQYYSAVHMLRGACTRQCIADLTNRRVKCTLAAAAYQLNDGPYSIAFDLFIGNT